MYTVVGEGSDTIEDFLQKLGYLCEIYPGDLFILKSNGKYGVIVIICGMF